MEFILGSFIAVVDGKGSIWNHFWLVKVQFLCGKRAPSNFLFLTLCIRFFLSHIQPCYSPLIRHCYALERELNGSNSPWYWWLFGGKLAWLGTMKSHGVHIQSRSPSTRDLSMAHRKGCISTLHLSLLCIHLLLLKHVRWKKCKLVPPCWMVSPFLLVKVKTEMKEKKMTKRVNTRGRWGFCHPGVPVGHV